MVPTVEKWTCCWSWEMNGDHRLLVTVIQRWINHCAWTWLRWAHTNNCVTTSCRKEDISLCLWPPSIHQANFLSSTSLQKMFSHFLNKQVLLRGQHFSLFSPLFTLYIHTASLLKTHLSGLTFDSIVLSSDCNSVCFFMYFVLQFNGLISTYFTVVKYFVTLLCETCYTK